MASANFKDLKESIRVAEICRTDGLIFRNEATQNLALILKTAVPKLPPLKQANVGIVSIQVSNILPSSSQPSYPNAPT